MDADALLRVAIGRVLTPLVTRGLNDAIAHLLVAIQRRIEHYYSMRAFQVCARLDVVTFKDPSIQHSFDLLRYRGYSEMTWNIFTNMLDLPTWAIQFTSQLLVLVSVFRGHREMTFLVGTTVARILIDALGSNYRRFFYEGGKVA